MWINTWRLFSSISKKKVIINKLYGCKQSNVKLNSRNSIYILIKRNLKNEGFFAYSDAINGFMCSMILENKTGIEPKEVVESSIHAKYIIVLVKNQQKLLNPSTYC